MLFHGARKRRGPGSRVVEKTKSKTHVGLKPTNQRSGKGAGDSSVLGSFLTAPSFRASAGERALLASVVEDAERRGMQGQVKMLSLLLSRLEELRRTWLVEDVSH